MHVELVKMVRFEAAHRNPNGNEAQRRLHGHSYLIDLVAAGEVASSCGWLLDFGDLRKAFRPFLDQLDHHYLNEVEGIEDVTLAGVRAWILERLGPRLPSLKDVRASIAGDCAFVPRELPRNPAYDLPVRVRFTFEAAQFLPQLPDGHPCRQLHGHSYRVEVGAEDLGRLRPHLEDLYEALDHRCLNDVSGLEWATCEVMGQWVWDRLARAVGGLTAVVVQETDTAVSIYRGM